MNRNLGHSITMTVGAGGSGSQGGHSSSGSGGAYVGSGGGTSGVSSSHNYRSDLMWKATVNLANSIVGVSLLSMPYVLKKVRHASNLSYIFPIYELCCYFRSHMRLEARLFPTSSSFNATKSFPWQELKPLPFAPQAIALPHEHHSSKLM